jgi:hypothetical protein
MDIMLGRSGLVAVIDDADAELVAGHRWSCRKDKHRTYVYNRFNVALHHAIHGFKPGCVTDHIDGDGLNNRRANLRHVTVAENAFNARLSKRNTSGVKGVSPTTINGRVYWNCHISAYGQRARTTFASFDKAVAWVKAKRAELHGEFANHGVNT